MMTDKQQAEIVADNRSRSRGWGRLVMGAFWVFGGAMTFLAALNLGGEVADPLNSLGPRLVALLAGITYLAVAVGITHNGRRMRIVAWAGLVISLVGPVIVAVRGLGASPHLSADLSPWADFGRGYSCLPLMLPLVGLVWMWWSDPRRIVEIAEGMERSQRG